MLPSTIEFHNTPGAEPSPDGAGWILPRYPRHAYETFDSPGFLTGQESTGVELRFVTDARHLRVFLKALERPTDVVVFKGDFHHSGHTLAPGVISCLHLTPPDNLAKVRAEALHKSFHPDVWRIFIDRGTIAFNGIDTFGRPVRPPLPQEKPALRWLAYGSSITHSSRNGYPHLAARRLRVDVQNKGLSGSCYIDPAAAEFIATGCEWDFATLELGVNMRSLYSTEEFERRARHLVARCIAAKPGRPIALITFFQNAADQLIEPGELTNKQTAFNRILRQIVQENWGNNVHLIEGTDIVDDLTFLTSDLLHPTDYGHARMAENLARALRPLIASLTA